MRFFERLTMRFASALVCGALVRSALVWSALVCGALLWGAGIVGGMPLTGKDIDPRIGTGGHGHTFPGPTLPFGMVQLSPDTRLTGWDGCSLYHDSDRVVYGFSHTHLSGTGVGDYGDILLMPMIGAPRLENGYPGQEGYGAPFNKADEVAEAGYYRTILADSGIEVELTTTLRTGVHRYQFPEGVPGHVLIDLTHRDHLLDADLRVVDDRTVEGFRRSRQWAADQLVHFRAVFSRPFTARSVSGETDAGVKTVKAVLSFGDQGGELLVQVAVSPVDAVGARGNLEAEWADFDFEKTRRRAFVAWNDALAPFNLGGASKEERTIMATAVYHSFIAPNLFNDVDGRYRGMDRRNHQAVDRDQYTVFSLWDTYRATHPLFTLVQRRRTVDFVSSALSHAREGGRLPVWELAGNETHCMIGYHSVSFIADAYVKGIFGFDPDEALNAMLRTARHDQPGLESYLQDGFISISQDGESVSKTLEYSYDDWCIARMAHALHRPIEGREFDDRAQSWRHLFDPVTRCFRPRDGGLWLDPYDPCQVDHHHTEANGWQYRFGAPHHMREHIELLGGDDACTAILDRMFTVDCESVGRSQPDITGRMGQYAHGNEPSHHVAWLYHFTGQPEKTRARVERILEEFYTAQPDGLIGNEDCGQMSSWYVLAAFGLYDVAPTSEQWLIVPPRHECMSIAFQDGAVFTTQRVGRGDVRRVTFNGKPLQRSWLSHAEVVGGGELVFELGNAGDWGQDQAHRPGIQSLSRPILSAPWAEASGRLFKHSTEVSLHTLDPGAAIVYTMDDERLPDLEYREPLVLRDSGTLVFQARKGDRLSPPVTVQFRKLPSGWTARLETHPNPQYATGGSQTLIDGLRGPDNWHAGGWLGYEGNDAVIVLDFYEPREVNEVGMSVLQDLRSWILMPTEMVVEVSADGVTFHEAGRIVNQVSARQEGRIRQDLMVPLDGEPVKSLRFRGVNPATMPEWHSGAGGKAYLFLDELIVE